MSEWYNRTKKCKLCEKKSVYPAIGEQICGFCWMNSKDEFDKSGRTDIDIYEYIESKLIMKVMTYQNEKR